MPAVGKGAWNSTYCSPCSSITGLMLKPGKPVMTGAVAICRKGGEGGGGGEERFRFSNNEEAQGKVKLY